MAGTGRPQVGDRVRVVLEGVVSVHCSDPAGTYWIGNPGSRSWIDPRDVTRLEVLPPAKPQPDWNPGDVVKVVGYLPFLYRSDRTWAAAGASGPTADHCDRLVAADWACGNLTIVHRHGSS